MERPTGITITAVLMSMANALGWMIIDWHAPHVRLRFVTYTVLIAAG